PRFASGRARYVQQQWDQDLTPSLERISDETQKNACNRDCFDVARRRLRHGHFRDGGNRRQSRDDRGLRGRRSTTYSRRTRSGNRREDQLRCDPPQPPSIRSGMSDKPELVGQTVVVIGGSSGIGLETARQARAEGANLILTARNADRLQRVGLGLGARIAAFDATDFSRLARVFDELPTPIDHVPVTGPRPHYAP